MTAVSETLHLVTGEYPPDRGGVAGYTAEVARALAREGADVHVWCPGRNPPTVEDRVRVHRSLGDMTIADLGRAARELNESPPPRRLIVQWVPHAFGQRSLNVGFCRWVSRRSRKDRDIVNVMVHEPGLGFSWDPRRLAAAAVHRAMAATLLRAASRVWVSTPVWAERLRGYVSPSTEFRWLPIPATVPVSDAARAKAAELRSTFAADDACVIGSFAPAGPFVHETLMHCVLPVLSANVRTALLLVGNGSMEARTAVMARAGDVASRVHASGSIDVADVSRYLSACDMAVQPYLDGVCTRHSSVATLLAHAVPVVTTEGPFTERLWRESGAVVLTPLGDRLATRIRVEELAASRTARQQLAERSSHLYDQRFHVRHTVAALLEHCTPAD